MTSDPYSNVSRLRPAFFVCHTVVFAVLLARNLRYISKLFLASRQIGTLPDDQLISK